MHKKISDESIRLEKIKKLKEKLLPEIEDRISFYKGQMFSNIPTEAFEYCVNESFALLKLKQYLKDEYCFMDYKSKTHRKNIVVYMISDEDLDIWLKKDYPFVDNYLSEARKVEYDISLFLNDEWFGYHFTNTIDKILYKSSIKDFTKRIGGY